MSLRRILLVLSMSVSTCIFFVSTARALSDKIYRELEIFTRIIDILDEQYVEPVDEERLVQGAIRGMLESLDPHTVYLPPEMYRDFKSDTTGKFGGIGIEITIKDGLLTVVAPLEDTPAYRAGIRTGDRIVKINNEPTKNMSLIDAVHRMRGPKGKKVVLSIWRDGLTKPQDIIMSREIIRMQSVKYEIPDQGYGLVRITHFQENTADRLKDVLKKMDEETQGGLRGILLDLRDNPGGLLSEAIKVSDIFMSHGIIVTTRGRNSESEAKRAHKNGPYSKIPIVVLVNHGSASASEIVAGALQDSHRAKILGTASFGKGSVQTLVEIGEKAALKLTIAKYYTPKGRSIEGKGIAPDWVVDMDRLKEEYPETEEKKRPDLSEYQKRKALEYLKSM